MLTAPPGEFSGLFSPFDIAVRGSVIAAVSGGSDSTALLLLLKGYIDQFSPGTRLVAVTIDHALRRESAGEAAAVARLSASIGVPHRILTWTGDKPSTGLAAAARETRHDLLAEAALAEKTDLVFTGHTADDQAETVLMRQARDARDGERGLAGIAPATLFDGKVWFARPLLATRREALRSFLRRKQIGWIDDPTNLNQRYERPRVRKRLGEAGGETAIADALRIASEAARKRHELGVEAAELIQLHADRPAAGLCGCIQISSERTTPRLRSTHCAYFWRSLAGRLICPTRLERLRFMQGWRQANVCVRSCRGRLSTRGRPGCSCCAKRAACRRHNRFGAARSGMADI